MITTATKAETGKWIGESDDRLHTSVQLRLLHRDNPKHVAHMTDQTPDLNSALAKAQAAMTNAPFDKANPHYKQRYASLASVIDTIRKPLADNGLSYTQTTQVRDGGFVLITTLRHVSGQCVESEYPLPQGLKPQELGSALTYARRYSLSALACISADEDDDAEGARKDGQTSSQPRPQATLPKKDAKEIYTKMQSEVRACVSRDQLKEWMEANKDRIAVLPEDWQNILRLQCEEMLGDLRQREVA